MTTRNAATRFLTTMALAATLLAGQTAKPRAAKAATTTTHATEIVR